MGKIMDVVNLVLSREGKNTYTQSSARENVFGGYSDCSSLMWKCFEKGMGIFIGTYTDAQLQHGKTVLTNFDQNVHTLQPWMLSKMQPGDLVYWGVSQTDAYHVEMYVGNGQLTGHGCGIGPTRKNALTYSHSKPLIQVRRFTDEVLGSGTTASASGQVNTASTSSSGPVVDKYTQIKQAQTWFNANYKDVIIKAQGQQLVVTGKFNTATRNAAVSIWKDLMNRRYGMSLKTVNSSFGSSCKSVASKATVRYGSDGTFTYICETLLAAKGFYTGAMDGLSGSMLVDAIKKYQSSKGLEVDGICGKETWYSLFN